MKLYGKDWTRRGLEARVGRIEQIGGLRRVQSTEAVTQKIRMYAALGLYQSGELSIGAATTRIPVGALVLSGLMAAVASFFLAAQIGVGDPRAGTSSALREIGYNMQTRRRNQ